MSAMKQHVLTTMDIETHSHEAAMCTQTLPQKKQHFIHDMK